MTDLKALAAQPDETRALIERLRALHVWPQSVADTYADTLTPRQIKQLYEVGFVAHEAADALQALAERVKALEEGLAVASAPKCFSCGRKVTEECPRPTETPCGRAHLGGSRFRMENGNE